MLRLVKKKNPHLADVDFSRAYSGVEMFSDDERRPRHIDFIVVDDTGRPILLSCKEDDCNLPFWFS
jgi:hypothetical protein